MKLKVEPIVITVNTKNDTLKEVDLGFLFLNLVNFSLLWVFLEFVSSLK